MISRAEIERRAEALRTNDCPRDECWGHGGCARCLTDAMVELVNEVLEQTAVKIKRLDGSYGAVEDVSDIVCNLKITAEEPEGGTDD